MKTIEYIESLHGQYKTEEELFKLLTSQLVYTKESPKIRGGQTCGMPPKGDLICEHVELDFKCRLPIGRSELKTKDKLEQIFGLYLLELLEI